MQNINIIYDLASPNLLDNQILNYEVANMVDGIHLYLLAEQLRNLGYQVMTADIFLKSRDFEGLNLIITEIETKNTQTLISHGCIPAICYCGESPLVIPKYYNKLQTKLGKFKHSYLFKGAINSFYTEHNMQHVLFWTNATNNIKIAFTWEKRKFLTLINSNKHSSKPLYIKKISDTIPCIKIALRYILNWTALHTFPGNIPDLYNARTNALIHFCLNKDFEFYGQGWNNNILGVSRKEQKLIRNSYRGKFPRGNANKHEILKNYKFALCFENTIFPGYVTEKIFDCILCGTIPIYYGAPDIDEFVPPDVFIDFRKFSSFNELEHYLINMPIEESKKFRDAAYEFVNSTAFEKYSLTGWQKDILFSIQDVINKYITK